MQTRTAVGAISKAARSERFHQRRARRDQAVRWFIGFGGISVILAVALIFFYLLWVVFPLLIPAQTVLNDLTVKPEWQNSDTVYLSIEEQQEVGLRISGLGEAEFFHTNDGLSIQKTSLPVGQKAQLIRASEAMEQNGRVAAALSDGRILVFQHRYETRFESGVESRKIIPILEFPYQDQPILQMPPGYVSSLAFSDLDGKLLLAASAPDGLVRVVQALKTIKTPGGDTRLESSLSELNLEFTATAMAVSGNHRWLYIGDETGHVHRYWLPDLQADQVLKIGDKPITAMTMLSGGISLLVGDEAGVIRQLFPVRASGNEFKLELIRQFGTLGSAITRILTEKRRKGFLALTAEHELAIFHSTAERLVHRESLSDITPEAVALSPRANGLLIGGRNGRLGLLKIRNRHPEISFSSLWQKVWYENHDEPEYIWQSSSASTDFEPKFSLTPLLFGTFKAAFYAMLFAIPLALMGAAYTAYFMSPGLRQWVKPTIEIMAALPTVILGFVAGLWFAPFLEENLAGIFMILLVLPIGVLTTAWIWHEYEQKKKARIFEGWEALVQIPVIIILVLVAFALAGPLQDLFFQGDLRDWLSREAGISYDQRNALVVGCAMGFAVIPTIFSIAEDAIFAVPKSLSDGSLALGATRWQSMLRVVLPMASPGIFSALIIGLGRAVGETMIVLMATGNTPLMDWNLFEGMRTLAANIAVEMPESEVAGSHYRVLFLAALVLFIFTFAVNTVAEILRQRLREKYSSL